jgi:hypothetical protein
MTPAHVRKRLEAALSEVAAAENALELALQELRRGIRAEKITVSASVENAFARVRVARAELATLREGADE